MNMKKTPFLYSILGVCLSGSMLLSGCGYVYQHTEQPQLPAAVGTVRAATAAAGVSNAAGTAKLRLTLNSGAEELCLLVQEASRQKELDKEKETEKKNALALAKLLRRDFAESVEDIRDLTKECDQKGTVVTLEYETEAYAHAGEGAMHRALKVYLPYGYDETNQYDVLYLLHGSMDSYSRSMADWWLVTFGETTRAVLDNMIKRELCKPVIVACPTYYVTHDTAHRAEEEKEATDDWKAAEEEAAAPEEKTEEDGTKKAEKNVLSLIKTALTSNGIHASRILYAPEYYVDDSSEFAFAPPVEYFPEDDLPAAAAPLEEPYVPDAPEPALPAWEMSVQESSLWSQETVEETEAAPEISQPEIEIGALEEIQPSAEITAPEVQWEAEITAPEIQPEAESPMPEEESVQPGAEATIWESERVQPETEIALAEEGTGLETDWQPQVGYYYGPKAEIQPEVVVTEETEQTLPDEASAVLTEEESGLATQEAEMQSESLEEQPAVLESPEPEATEEEEAPSGSDPYGSFAISDDDSWEFSHNWSLDANWQQLFSEELRNDIIPAVERAFSTYAGGDVSEKNLIATREHRAFAGLSLGSRAVAYSGLTENMDLFSWYGTYSGIWVDFGQFRDSMEDRFEDYEISYWYNGNGNSDFALGEHKEFYRRVLAELPEKFEEGQNIAFITLRDGGHSYSSWLADLSNSLLVFFTE